MIDVRFSPLPLWPYPSTENRRGRNTFKASWSDTLALLERELDWLDGAGVIIGAGFTGGDLRLDGWPKANDRPPAHPGIELSFDSIRGRLSYHTDVCEGWQSNVRSIALGLEALRAVDRYGITGERAAPGGGRQYAGFAAIEAAPVVQLKTRGERLIQEYGSEAAALRGTHPDYGGDRADFEAVMAARGGR